MRIPVLAVALALVLTSSVVVAQDEDAAFKARFEWPKPGVLVVRKLDSLSPGEAQLLVSESSRELHLVELEALDAEVARVLATYEGHTLEVDAPDLDLPTTLALVEASNRRRRSIRYLTLGLRQLDAHIAKALATSRLSTLKLPRLGALSVAAARELQGFGSHEHQFGRLELGSPKLSANSAAELAKTKAKYLGLALTSLDGPTAKALVGFKGDVLLFAKLKALSPEAAAQLSSFSGSTLGFPALEALTGPTAKALVPWFVTPDGELRPKFYPPNSERFSYGRIILRGLERIDADAAPHLAQFRSLVVNLPRLRTLDPAVAAALTRVPHRALHMSGLEALDAKTAQALGGFRGNTLNLSGVRSLDPAAAAALSSYGQSEHDELNLNGLTSIGAATAKALTARGQSRIALNGLTRIDAQVAAILLDAKASQRTLKGLSFDALEALDVPTAKVLAGRENVDALSLGGLKRLDPAVAAELAAFKGALTFGGLTSLEPIAAEALAGPNRGALSLLALEDISVPLARALAKNRRTLNVGGPAQLSVDVAAALSGGRLTGLNLVNLRTLTPNVAEQLANAEYLVIPSVTSVTPEVAEHLSRVPRGVKASKAAEGMIAEASARKLQEVREALTTPEGLAAVSLADARACRGSPVDLPKLTRLSPAQLGVIRALQPATLRVGLKTLDTDTAAILGKALILSLDGLTRLDADAARLLHSRELSLNGLTALTPEVAQALAMRPEGDYRHEKGPVPRRELSLNGVRSIDAAVAKGLSKITVLKLNGLTTLSAEVASLLDDNDLTHEALHLDGLRSLDREAGLALAKLDRGPLSLRGLGDLNPEVAAQLGSRDPLILGVRKLSPRLARALSGRRVVFTRLGQLTPAAALQLSARVGGILLFPAVQLVSARTAQLLARAGITDESLRGLTSIDRNTAAELAVWTPGNTGAVRLALGGMAPLAPPVAQELTRGRVDVYRVNPQTQQQELDPALKAAGEGVKHSKTLEYVRQDRLQGFRAEALKTLRAITDNDPTLLLRERAELYAEEAQWDAALADLDASLKQLPGNTGTLLLRARVRLEAGKLDGARVDVDAVLKLEADDPEALSLRARVRLAQKDRAGAARDAARAVALDPFDAVALLIRGQTNADAKAGLEDVLAAAELAVAESWQRVPADPTSVPVDLSELPEVQACVTAAAQYRASQLEKALASLSRALEVNSGFAPAWLARGRVRLAQGDADKAKQEFESAVNAGVAARLRPGVRTEGIVDRALRFAETADADKQQGPATRALINRALLLAPREHRLVLARAKATGTLEQKVSDYTLVMEWTDGRSSDWIGSDWAWSLVLRAEARFHQGDHAGCFADYAQWHQRALREDPESAEHYREEILHDNLEGFVKREVESFQEEGKTEVALTVLARAFKAFPGELGALRLLSAKLRAKQGDLAGAVADEKKSTQPETSQEYWERGRLLAVLGDTKRALECLEAAAGDGRLWPYPSLWVAGLGGDVGDAMNQSPRGEAPAGWTAKLIAHAKGELSAEAFVAAAAEAQTEKQRNEQLCEALGYAGMHLERAGKTKEAKAHYEKCVATGVTSFVEYEWADSRLKVSKD